MSTHKRTRSDSEDSMISSRSSSLLKRIKLEADSNSPPPSHPSEPRLIPQEKSAPISTPPTPLHRGIGVLERLDSMSTQLVLDGE